MGMETAERPRIVKGLEDIGRCIGVKSRQTVRELIQKHGLPARMPSGYGVWRVHYGELMEWYERWMEGGEVDE